MNDYQQKKLLEEAPMPAEKNKYEKDEELLKKYENECRFGTTKPTSYLLNKAEANDDENDEDTMENIDYFKFKSNFIAKANMIKEGSRSSMQSNAQSMKNDFNKTDEDEEDTEREQRIPHVIHATDTASAKVFIYFISN